MPRSIHDSPSAHRSGISLLEVLIAMFTLSVGLLGMASLIPVGNYHAAKAVRSDHAAACGRAAMREIRVRRMLEPGNWSTPGSNPFDSGQIRPFAIDPLAIHGPANSTAFPNDGSAAHRMPRIGLTSISNFSEAENIFRWTGDNFTAPAADEDARPIAQGSRGEYSWMAIAEPSRTENAGLMPLHLRRMYNVSVVVFYQRDLTDLGEKQYDATLTGGGGATIQDLDQEIEPGQWIMFSGRWEEPNDSIGSSDESRDFHRWYRVLNVSDHPSNNNVFVMLSGPTWPNNALVDGTSAKATIMPGVEAVYERSIHLDVPFLNP